MQKKIDRAEPGAFVVIAQVEQKITPPKIMVKKRRNKKWELLIV